MLICLKEIHSIYTRLGRTFWLDLFLQSHLLQLYDLNISILISKKSLDCFFLNTGRLHLNQFVNKFFSNFLFSLEVSNTEYLGRKRKQRYLVFVNGCLYILIITKDVTIYCKTHSFYQYKLFTRHQQNFKSTWKNNRTFKFKKTNNFPNRKKKKPQYLITFHQNFNSCRIKFRSIRRKAKAYVFAFM